MRDRHLQVLEGRKCRGRGVSREAPAALAGRPLLAARQRCRGSFLLPQTLAVVHALEIATARRRACQDRIRSFGDGSPASN